MIRKWDAVRHLQQFGCTINIGLHRGTLYAFRSFLFGRDVWIASQVPEVEANHLVLVSVLGTYRTWTAALMMSIHRGEADIAMTRPKVCE